MRTVDAVKYFERVSILAERLGISRKSVWKWGEYPPPGRQYELEVMTEGALKAEKPGAGEARRDTPEPRPEP